MSGLIYRIFAVSKKKLFLLTFILFVFELLILLTAVSCNCGNLAKLDEGTVKSVQNMLCNVANYFAPFFILFIMIAVIVDTVSDDLRTHWRSYAYTLPVSALRYNAAFYIMIAAIGTSLIAFLTLCSAIVAYITDRNFTADSFKKILVLSSVVIIYSLIEYNLVSLVRNGKAAKAISVVTILAFIYGGFFILFRDLLKKDADQVAIIMQKKEQFEKFTDNISPYLPFILIGAFVLNWFISVKLTQRREK